MSQSNATDAGDGPAPRMPIVPPVPAAKPPAEPDTEIELKLLCDPRDLEVVAQAPVVLRYARDEAKTADLVAIYYDTTDLALHRAGMTLRVRTDGQKFVMTVKSAASGTSKLLERAEWQVSVSDMQPDRAALAQSGLADTLAAIQDLPLTAIFRTSVRRQTKLLDTPFGIVELALDQGQIVAGDRIEPISEVELELKGGSAAAIFAVAQELMAVAALRPSTRTKSERGHELAAGITSRPKKLAKLAFPRKATLDQALDIILRAVFSHLLETQHAAEHGRDPEGIHQYRVSLRRLRSVLGIIKTIAPSDQVDRLRADARWLMTQLNDARDWDVFVTQTLPKIVEQCPAIGGFDDLDEAARTHRRTAHQRARIALEAPRTGQFQIALGLWIEQAGWQNSEAADLRRVLAAPAREFAASALSKLHRKALKRGRGFAHLTPDERHQLRIAIKKSRYAADFFLPLFGQSKSSQRYAKAMSRLQEKLGHSNDISVMDRLVGQITAKPIPAAGQRAAGAMLGWQAAQRDDDADLVRLWDKFRQVGIPVAD